VDAVRTATLWAAELMRWDDRIGSISPGKFADAIAIEGDPLASPELFMDVPFVMKGGEIVRGAGQSG
jgi:imidazolonepropionase-like amidohydrolase